MEQEINEERKNKLVEFIQSEHYTPMKLKELAAFFGVPKDERGQFDALVDVILREGKGVLTEKGKLMPPDNTMRVGIFLGTKKGFGFVRVEDEPDDDVFIPEHGCKDAFHGDKVMIRIWKKGKGNKAREGEIVKILERNTSIVVGTYQKSRNYGFVVADNEKFGKDIFIPKKKDMGAVNDHKVVVKITDFGSDEKKPEGEIVEILGHINDPGVDIISVIRGYGLPEEFPEEVMREVANKPDNVTEEEKATRKDLRDLQTVTIDGEDAIDLDDAITLERSADGVYHLGVHIADVSYYVKEGTCLDKEAVNRGTSVYLVDRVIPMLPHRLSNGICSLNAHEDRLALSCLMDIDSTGKMIAHEICETLICVDERMNYTDVNDILTHHKEETCHRYEALVPMFEQMKDLAHIVRKKRKQQVSSMK